MNAGKVMHSYLSGAYGGKQDKIAISPYDDFRTKEARDWRDNQPDNVLIIKQKEADLYAELTERVRNHPEVKKILDGATIEAERMVERKVKEYNVKGILDIVATKKDIVDVIDWKFVSSQVFDGFEKKALYQHYDLQASVYDFLEEPTNVYFVAIENEAPHRIKLFHCDSSFLESGAEKFNKAFKILEKEKWRQPTFDIDEVGELISWNHYNG